MHQFKRVNKKLVKVARSGGNMHFYVTNGINVKHRIYTLIFSTYACIKFMILI